MDIVGIISDGLRVIFGFLLVLFLPGFNLSLIYFPRSTDLSIIERLVYSAVLSIGSVMLLVLFMEYILGVNTTPRNITLFICVLSELALLVWWCERWYLKSRVKLRLEPLLSMNFRELWNNYEVFIDSLRDWILRNTRRGVVYHTVEKTGENHVDHSYLIDVGDEIDIQQVIEFKGFSAIEIVQPPHPQTRYFELVIREYTEEGLSLIDDLQLYPVLVTKRPDIKILRFVIKRGTATITERLSTKESTSETEWIYSHDFHLFAIIHPEDTLDQMVDRIIAKLDEIVSSIHSGSRVSSHIEVTQMLRDSFDAVMEQPRPATPPPINAGERAERPDFAFGAEQKEIPKRPVILPEVEPRETIERPEVPAGAVPKKIVTGSEDLLDIEPGKNAQRPEAKVTIELYDSIKPPEVQFSVEPREIFRHPPKPHRVELKETQKPPEVRISEPKEIVKHQDVLPSLDPKLRDRRKLQKEILRDLNMFGITPDSFGGSKRAIENIKIPEKKDVNKQLADVEEEVKDLDWLYE